MRQRAVLVTAFAILPASASAAAPVSVTPPSVIGEAMVGQDLTCEPGAWDGSPTNFEVTWLAGGQPVNGRKEPSYQPTTSQVGAEVSCRITATNSDGQSAADSAAVKIAPLAFTLTPDRDALSLTKLSKGIELVVTGLQRGSVRLTIVVKSSAKALKGGRGMVVFVVGQVDSEGTVRLKARLNANARKNLKLLTNKKATLRLLGSANLTKTIRLT